MGISREQALSLPKAHSGMATRMGHWQLRALQHWTNSKKLQVNALNWPFYVLHVMDVERNEQN